MRFVLYTSSYNYLLENNDFSLFFTKASPTDGPTNQPPDGLTDGRTDMPGYRDASTHLKRIKKVVNILMYRNVLKYKIDESDQTRA